MYYQIKNYYFWAFEINKLLLWKRKDQQVLLSYYDTTKKYCCR